MNLSEKGENLLKSIEVLSTQPYDDQKGIKSAPIKSWVKGATIGYGYLISQAEWDKYKNGITVEQANALYDAKIKPYVDAVNSNIKVKISQSQFDALVMLCYNIGITAFKNSSVVKMVNGLPSSYKTLEAAWKAWNKSQGKFNQGVLNRRNAEWDVYTKGIYSRW